MLYDLSSKARYEFLASPEGLKWRAEHSARLTRRPSVPEVNAKRSATCLARGGMSHPHSEESKRKISEAKQKFLASPEGLKWRLETSKRSKEYRWWTNGKEESLALLALNSDWHRGRLKRS